MAACGPISRGGMANMRNFSNGYVEEEAA